MAQKGFHTGIRRQLSPGSGAAIFWERMWKYSLRHLREVVKIAGNKKESDGGVMAIENSIAGSILPNYNLLKKSNLKIAGEIYLQIKQNLLVNPGVKTGRYPRSAFSSHGHSAMPGIPG